MQCVMSYFFHPPRNSKRCPLGSRINEKQCYIFIVEIIKQMLKWSLLRKNNNARFVLYSDKEVEDKIQANKNRNTTKSEECANSAFQKFLSQYGKDNLEYWFYDEEELDSMLAKFWFGSRKDTDLDAESNTDNPKKMNLMSSANAMKHFRYALNRILKTKGHLYDIMSNSTLSFRKSQQAFADSQKELK